MRPDLEVQVGRYVGFVDEVAPPVTLDEIVTERVGPGMVQPLRPHPPKEGPARWVPAAAAAAVLILVGGVMWLAGVREAGPRVATRHLPDPAPSTVLTQTQPPTTHPGSVFAPDGTDISAELQAIHDYISQMSRRPDSPKPLFDTSTLGTEFRLQGPLDPAEKEALTGFWGSDPEQIDLLWAVAVYSDDTPQVGATYWIETLTVDETVTLQVGIDIWGRGGSSHEIPPTEVPLDATFPVIVYSDGYRDGGGAVAVGGLPAAASVVATVVEDGTAYWQRPVSGVAVFRPGAIPSMETDTATVELTVLDANGAEIMRIEFARTGWYRVHQISP